jgi:hypothetical protein
MHEIPNFGLFARSRREFTPSPSQHFQNERLREAFRVTQALNNQVVRNGSAVEAIYFLGQSSLF